MCIDYAKSAAEPKRTAHLKSAAVVRITGAAFCLLFSFFLPPAPAHAQTPKWPSSGSKAADQQAATVKESSLEERTAAVNERLEQLRKRFAESAPAGVDSTLPAGVTSEEWAESQQLLRNIETQYQKHLDSLRALKEVRQSQQELKQEAESWQGFKEPPPYPVIFVDGLWDQVRAKDREIQVIRVEHGLYQNLMVEAHARLRGSSQALRQADEQMETTRDAGQAIRARWLRDLSEVRNRHAEALVATLESEQQLKTETLAYRTAERELLQRQAMTALLASPLSAEDRDAKVSALVAEQRELEIETERAIKAEQQAQDQLQATRERLGALREPGAAAQPDDTQFKAPEVARLQHELDFRKADAAVAASIVKIMRLLHHANSMQQQMWDQRYQVDRATRLDAIDKAVAGAEQVLDRVKQFRAYLLSELDLIQRRIDGQRQRLAAWQADQDDKKIAEQELRSYEKGEAMLRRGLAKADEFEALITNWLEGMRQKRETATLGERLRGLWAELSDVAARFWKFELIAVEDKIVAEGREIVGKRSVTLGKIIQVLLILVVGLWLTAYVAAHGRRMMLRRLPGKESSALLIFRVFSLLAGVGLVVFALVTVNIPLTVFAFLGGALAIAVGFGAQNILNNFISGLILLFERPIKVGDIVEVEGVRGQIANIGGRCCQMRRFDGIDMLIPNSSLLEKNVTNWTLSDQQLRFTITLRAAYGLAIREVVGLIRRAVEEHSRVLRNPAPEIFAQNFGDNAMEFRLDFWVDISVESNWERVMSDIRVRIEELFREAKIVTHSLNGTFA